MVQLLHRPRKDALDVCNYRPITLLNVDYKIQCKVIANRSKTVISSVISKEQAGFMPQQYIGENRSVKMRSKKPIIVIAIIVIIAIR